MNTSRCKICGRFVKRGIWNHIKHYEVCPERELILISKNWEFKLVKLKNYNNGNEI